ncbi:tudor domain-containing protein [Aureococcus anophagefferens]|nr:tudor domain-containing protein [Aureococcus anophagefferens]
MPPRKTGFAGLMAKRTRSSPRQSAPRATPAASAKARPLAVAAYGKAAACHASPDVAAHHTAAELEKRASFADGAEGRPGGRGGSAASGTQRASQASRKALGWYARRGLLDDAISTVSKHVKALADANLDPGPSRRFGAKAAEDLLVAFKPGIRSRAAAAFDSGASPALQGARARCRAGGMDNSLDFSMSQSGAVDFPSVNTPSKKDALAVGAAVEARHNGGRKWYPGKISRPTTTAPSTSPTTTATASRASSRSSCGRPAARRAGPSAGQSTPRARASALRGKSKFYPGKIAKANDDGSYDIAYDDGERGQRHRGPHPAPRRRPAPAAPPSAPAVQARYRGKSKLYPGKVAKDNGDGTYDIDYDDGEKESNVEARYRGKPKYYAGVIAKDNGDGTYDIDSDGEKKSSVAERIKASAAAPAATGTGGAFAVGAKVEARYRGKPKYYAGVIAKDNGDGTYDIDYDDEKESKVAEALIKASAAAAAAAPAAGKGGAFAVGAKVEARYRGKAKYYAGVIATDNGDGTYNIDYDDGEKETKVAEALIKASAAAARQPLERAALCVGAKVDARYRGKSKFYAGVIATDNGDGTYNIDYDDGEKETKVAERVKASAAAPAPAAGKGGAFPVGAKVEARYRGKSKYYAGVIAVDNGGGTYNIDYDDGEKETKVAEALIKASAAAPAATGTGGAFAVGAKVEAKYRGKSKYYAGVIATDNGSGTYNIDYDDGEKETKVAGRIKASAAAPAPAATGTGGAFAVGAKVEARYRGKSKYYAGVIAKDNGDGTYDIDYDDGEKSRSPLGKSKYYAGVIAVNNGDGTYNIDYDDGEKESKVAEALIKASAAAPAPAAGKGGAFPVGAKVEARYRGKSKFYAGVIAVDNGDGTYNIDYDDGEKETKVAEALIKASAAPGGSGHGRRLRRRREARHCVFRPKTRKDPNSEVKESSDGEGPDAEAKTDNFIQRQDAWTRKVRREEAAIGKANYGVKLDKKVCPSCGAVQSYDEVEEKRDRCVECAVAYTRKNKGDIDGFRVRRRGGEAECKMDALARDVDHGRSVGAKRVFRDGRVARRRPGPAAPSGTISVESGLAETLSAQRQSRLVDEQQKALEAEVERRVTVATAERVLAAARRGKRRRWARGPARLREAEASQLDHVKAQVALLHSKYDFVRPPPVPLCLAEARRRQCYEDNKGGGVAECAKLVDAHSACARRVADDLARSLQQS